MAEAKKATKAKIEKSVIAKKHGKKYAEKSSLVEKKLYSLKDAMELLPKLSYSKFDATTEIHININSNSKKADQIVRSTIVLPHGTGKVKKIAAFVTEEKMKEAVAAGADLVGNEDLINNIKNGKIEFDIAVAMPEIMKDLGKIAKILGQKGLMPSPKAGTVSDKIENTIQEIKKGKIEFRTDKDGIIHSPFGKVSFGAEKLFENVKTLLKAINAAKPAGIKGKYIKNIAVTVTMGPGIKLDINKAMEEINK